MAILPGMVVRDSGGTLQYTPVHRVTSTTPTAAATGVYEGIVSTDGGIQTYYAAGVDLVPAATATAFLLIKGSATKTVRVRRIRISAMATAYGESKIKIARWAAAPSGGTLATAVTIALADTANAAATAVVQSATANMTEGTPETVLEYGNLSWVPLTTAATSSDGLPYTFDAGRGGEQAIVLRGVAQYCVVGLDGDAVPSGGVWHYGVCWTESSED